MRIGKLRNKSCYCGSGIKYKNCHLFQNQGLIKTDTGYEIPEIDLSPEQRMGKLIYQKEVKERPIKSKKDIEQLIQDTQSNFSNTIQANKPSPVT